MKKNIGFIFSAMVLAFTSPSWADYGHGLIGECQDQYVGPMHQSGWDCSSAGTDSSSGDLAFQSGDEGLQLTFSSEMFFGTGSSDLNGSAESETKKLSHWLKKNPGKSVRVEGYTDNVGDTDSNKQLSEKRAEAVAGSLIHYGIDKNRVQSIGYGETNPVASNETDQGRQTNRRVVIVIPN
jgi:outer membrane protein OmpA-like peptidoglycan-associated protein